MSRKLRVLQAMGGARHGGAEQFFLRLVAALHRAGQDQLALVRHAAHAATLAATGVAVRRLPFGGFLDLRTRLGFRSAVSDYRPDIVLTWMSRASRLCPRGDFVHVARLGGYYDLKHYRNCTHLVGNTRDLVAYFIREGWPKERAHYLPNFAEASPAAAADRRALGTPEAVPLALALGRLHRNKGFDLLLDAMARLPDLHLWIAGTGELQRELEAQAARLGVADRVRFLGWREDVPALLAAADLLVSSSRWEPLGNVVLEAWMAGVPVVATASAGPSELIADRVSGRLVPLEDAAALAAAIAEVAGDRELRATLVAGGRAAYEADFTEARIVARYQAFFAEVAG
jgi:glycosyltransferase involved in cell wall biosynthesis